MRTGKRLRGYRMWPFGNELFGNCAKRCFITVASIVIWLALMPGRLCAAEKPAMNSVSKADASGFIRSPQAVNPLKQLVRSIDRGDAYRTQTGVRKLYRHHDAVAVRVANTVKADRLVDDMTKADAPLASYTARKHPGGWVLFTATDSGKRTPLNDSNRLADNTETLRASSLGLVNPVFVDPESGLILVATEDIVICLENGVDPSDYFGAKWPDIRPLPGAVNQFIERLAGVQAEDVLAEVGRRMEDSRVAWAEPDFLMEVVRHYTPNDSFYSNQWHLHNTGQSGATVDADVDAPEAWTITRGTNAIVIAVIDDSVQTTHPDLAANIFTNTSELVDGLDNDNNGYKNDYNGWDFFFGDNNPNPTHADDTHGTPCAGVAAAVGDNAVGVAGMAYRCRILPVKVFDGNSLVADSMKASALRYAAGLTTPQPWKGADIISMSLSFSQSAIFDSAIVDAATKGRNGKGCLIFAATGNGGGGWYAWGITNIAAGSRVFRFEYVKDSSGIDGLDAVWLDDLSFPGGTEEGFEGSFPPPGWTTGGSSSWTQNTDPTYVRGTGLKSARSGGISHSKTNYLQGTLTVGAGTLTFFSWTSTEARYDVLKCYVDGVLRVTDPGGVNSWTLGAVYPARHTNTMGIGASTDFDYRSDYSQFGSGLDFVAPSGGGNAGITTTDRTGADGYVSGDYESGFSGTSSATPLAAGIGALVLSRNPTLTQAAARSILLKSCDKIGGGTYVGGEAGAGGTNVFYGYGRINAHKALINTPEPTVNSTPTNILLSGTNVAENLPVGTTVGSFSTQDPDTGNTFSYALTNGTGGADNGSFMISVGNLLTAASFNYEVKSSYSIRVQSTDQGSLSTQLVFAIRVMDVDETPVFYGPSQPINGNIVLRWSSTTNKLYTVHHSTNLLTGFSVLQSNIPATPAINSYTQSVLTVPQKFWKITTDP